VERWARDLYELRSQIIHGEVVEGKKLMASKDYHYPHFKIARDIFNDCLLFLLEGCGHLDIRRAYKEKVIKDLRNLVISNKIKASDILKKKNRYSYKEFVANKDLYKEFIAKCSSFTPLDNSASALMPKIYEIIFSISEDWIAATKAEAMTRLTAACRIY